MDPPSANPYTPPNGGPSQPTADASGVELHPVWIWLAIAVVISCFTVPGDPVTMLIALAYGLVCFGVGSILGSSLHVLLRVLPLVLWVVPAIWFPPFGGERYYPFYSALSAFYALVSIGIGAWACRSIQHGRLRILSSFCGGYVLGSIVGILGTVVGAVVATIVAKRCLRMPDVSGGR